MGDEKPTDFKVLKPNKPSLNALEWERLSSETIDLGSLFNKDVTSSGSFDLRGFRATSFAKLLEAVPIPALLVSPARTVMFCNQACRKIGAAYDKMQGEEFSSLFPSPEDGIAAEALIQKVLAKRTPLVTEGILGTGKTRMWGRMHLRSVRVEKQRLVLVIVEDITLEKQSRPQVVPQT